MVQTTLGLCRFVWPTKRCHDKVNDNNDNNENRQKKSWKIQKKQQQQQQASISGDSIKSVQSDRSSEQTWSKQTRFWKQISPFPEIYYSIHRSFLKLEDLDLRSISIYHQIITVIKEKKLLCCYGNRWLILQYCQIILTEMMASCCIMPSKSTSLQLWRRDMVRKIIDPYARYFLNTVLAEKRSKTL